MFRLDPPNRSNSSHSTNTQQTPSKRSYGFMGGPADSSSSGLGGPFNMFPRSPNPTPTASAPRTQLPSSISAPTLTSDWD